MVTSPDDTPDADAIRTDPVFPPVLVPPTIEMPPPDSDAFEEWPALISISPPEPVKLEPTSSCMPPPSPPKASPEDTRTEPDAPKDEVPLAITIDPLVPRSPALDVASVRPPDDELLPTPLWRKISPPVPVDDRPPWSLTDPPFAASPAWEAPPTRKSVPPTPLCVASSALPATISASPPEALGASVSPAVTTTDPPWPKSPVPTSTLTEPPAPFRAELLATRREPEPPPLAVPVRSVISPDMPRLPAFAVSSRIDPLAAPDLLDPVRRFIVPPRDPSASDEPDLMLSAPPGPRPLAPTAR
eukprot:scaffold1748_cov258-Pinguiococcus_pyrenoidosus.AAC.19